MQADSQPGKQAAKPAGLGADIYTGVATYGRFRAVVGAALAVIIALTIIIIGVMALRDKHTASAAMTVTAVSSCQAEPVQTDGNGQYTTYRCIIGVSFPYQGATVIASGIQYRSGAPPAVGDKVTLRFNPKKPNDVIQEIPPRLLAGGLIAGGLLLGGVSVGLAVLTFRSKGFAAMEGTIGIAESLGHLRGG